MKHCKVCMEAGCIFDRDPIPVWAAQSDFIRKACEAEDGMAKRDHEELKSIDYRDEEMHDDRVELDTVGYNKALSFFKEADEDGLNQHTPGAKLDQGKVDVFRHFMAMFPDAMTCVAWVSEYGERKYSYMGWSKVNDGVRRYTAAMNRHILDEARGEVYDADPAKGSDLAHAAQAAWNAMARLQLMIKEGEVEIRKGREIKK